ncbi:hypothetical protein RLO149_c011620 [Roseobacter litoralis Och 149]|uniref:Uncharacterized protein n=1 Tax=Roseobacter litoralis (strain ATCC 49566 / DSM 6996 / JCM 21268 / NBRC 15278 / OCh 149) TaxID=391595 RepID=F7ZBX4_ROSLO|nr:hypothetical protein RLO149_c011620 [Roseobacter litoralis Och 149]
MIKPDFARSSTSRLAVGLWDVGRWTLICLPNCAQMSSTAEKDQHTPDPPDRPPRQMPEWSVDPIVEQHSAYSPFPPGTAYA